MKIRFLGRSAAQARAAVARMEVELRSLLQAGCVAEARTRIAGLSPELRAHSTFARWLKALQPPQVRVVARASTGSVEKNAAWLRSHADEHDGRWIALREGVLLGSHPNHVALHRELEQRGELHGAIFVRIADR
jgi:hypothetical protein